MLYIYSLHFCLSFSHTKEPEHTLPPGPAPIGHSYQSVLQSAHEAAATVRHVALPRGKFSICLKFLQSKYL